MAQRVAVALVHARTVAEQHALQQGQKKNIRHAVQDVSVSVGVALSALAHAFFFLSKLICTYRSIKKLIVCFDS